MSGERMDTSGRSCIWLFHRGALGDSVLLWPRLREAVRMGRRVVLVTDGSKARLAARETGVEGVDAEGHRYGQLWREDGRVEAEFGVQLVVDCIGAGSAVFSANLVRMFPGALIQTVAPPRGGRDAMSWMMEHPLSRVAARSNEGGPIVVHVGAGSQTKRWPLTRWEGLITKLRGEGGLEVAVLAGEVEQERFTAAERRALESLGGRFIGDVLELAEEIRVARLFIGCDSGPSHLAAQLGVRTLALFGPTDPSVWAPVGPLVRPVFPSESRVMDWLEVEAVLREADVLLSVHE